MEVIAIILIAFIAFRLQSVAFNKLVYGKLGYQCEFSVNEAHEGDEIHLVETIHNKKILPVPWLLVDIHSSRWLDYASTKSVVTQDSRRVTSSFYLSSYQKTTRRWNLKCLKRGDFSIENVTLLWGDLLGIKTSSIPVKVNARLVVYPEVVNIEDMFVPASYIQGDTIVKRWIIDDPFVVSGTREYTPRDPMNRIHWKATAREGKLMVRKNDFTSQFGLTVLLNIQSVEFEYSDVIEKDKIELGIKIAATIFDRALRMGMLTRLATNGYAAQGGSDLIFTNAASGREHISELLAILAKLQLKNVIDFENMLTQITCDIVGNEVILITSYISKGICDAARELKAQNNVVKLFVLDRYIDTGDLPGDIDTYILSGVDGLNEVKSN